jgi:hypothetical protein
LQHCQVCQTISAELILFRWVSVQSLSAALCASDRYFSIRIDEIAWRSENSQLTRKPRETSPLQVRTLPYLRCAAAITTTLILFSIPHLPSSKPMKPVDVPPRLRDATSANSYDRSAGARLKSPSEGRSTHPLPSQQLSFSLFEACWEHTDTGARSKHARRFRLESRTANPCLDSARLRT